ncbi:MAG: hypothetical protein RIR18_815, partial [Pseudomonadota bacterium]
TFFTLLLLPLLFPTACNVPERQDRRQRQIKDFDGEDRRMSNKDN